MEKKEILVQAETLKNFVKKVFISAGLAHQDAETVADVLIWASLRGIDSHGVLRVTQYVHNIDIGFMNPKPKIRILNETPAILFIEADHAFGPVVTTFAMNQVIEKARKVGIGWALIRNTTHQAAMGYYALIAAKQNMVGMTSVASPPYMAYYGAKGKGVSPAPIAIAVPAKRYKPLLLDMATGVVAFGKIFLAIDKGVSIPEGWALDKNGNPTTDPKQAAMVLPLGGPKGSGLALMLECLQSVMADNPRLEPILAGKEPNYLNLQNSFVASIDISKFMNIDKYKDHIDSLIDGIKALPKAEGFNEILVPGEPEERTYEERIHKGIPLPEGTIRNLQSVAKRFSIELPLGL